MKMLLSLAIVLCTYAFNASAVSLEFAFDVNSSGVSIYPCDAGIKHATHQKRVCYDRVEKKSCDPSACTSADQCNCVCTGGAAGDDGEYRMDFMKATYADWTENGEYASSSVTSVAVGAGQTDFSRIFTNKNEWDKQLTALTFNLGSERYGAEYFLDVCYRGPQIEYFMAYQNAAVSNSNHWPNFSIKLQATVTDVASNNLRYSQLAKLKVKTITTCDVQGEGAYIYAHSGVGGSSNGNNGNNNGNNGNHNGIENGNGSNGNHGNGNNGNGNGNNGSNNNGTYVYDNAQAHQITGVTGGDKTWNTAETSFNAGANLVLLNDWINLGNAKTPRFCKVRYVFSESTRNDSEGSLTHIRKWQNHKARICTYTDIQESINL